MEQKNWRNNYPLNTFQGRTREELIEAIDAIRDEAYKEARADLLKELEGEINNLFDIVRAIENAREEERKRIIEEISKLKECPKYVEECDTCRMASRIISLLNK